MTHPQDLQGAKALVTGGGTGVGLGIARCLLRHGARVVIAARRLEILEAAAGKLRLEIPGAEIRVSGRAGPLFPDEGEAMQIVAAMNASHIDVRKVVEIAESVYVVPDGLIGGGDVSLAAKLDLSTGLVTRAALSEVEIEGVA